MLAQELAYTSSVGILGGIGPAATLTVHERIIAQAIAAGAKQDNEFPRLLIHNAAPCASSLDGVGGDPLTRKRVEAAIRDLQSLGCRYVVPACNSLCAVSTHLVDVPQLCLQQAEPASVVGVICSQSSRASGLFERGAARLVYLPQAHADELIAAGMHAAPKQLNAAFDELRALGAETIIIGCTDVSVHRPPAGWPDDVIDSADVIANFVLKVGA